MKKNFFALLLILLVVPACRRPARRAQQRARKSEPVHIEKANRPVHIAQRQKPLIEEDLDSFNLIDDDQHFELASKDSASSIQDNKDILLVDDHEDQKYTFKTVLYDFNKAMLRKDQKSIADQNIKIATTAAKDGYDVIVEGHACNSAGAPTYNLALSQKRAQDVVDYCVNQGIDPRSIKGIGRGIEMLIVPSGDKLAQAPNRRVEMYAIPKIAPTA